MLLDQWELVVLGVVEQALLDQWDLVVLGLVVVDAAWANFDQFEQDLEFDLHDPALHPQIDLEH